MIDEKEVTAYVTMQRKEIQRGDLFYYDFGKREGSVQSGERPVMVIQADNFNANVVVSGTVTTTNGVGDYEGTLTFTGPERQLWYMLSEGAFVQQVNGGEENWTYDDTVYGLLLKQGTAYATDDAASPYTVLILPAISVETDDGVRYDIDWDAIDWNAPQSEDMRFTNTYTKSTTEPGTPDTGDNSNPTLWFALLAVSGVGAAGAAIYSRKRKYSAE